MGSDTQTQQQCRGNNTTLFSDYQQTGVNSVNKCEGGTRDGEAYSTRCGMQTVETHNTTIGTAGNPPT
jgi:hypothetical protein